MMGVRTLIVHEGDIRMLYKVPLILSPQPEGGFTVTSPVLPELVTEGDTVAEALANVQDALAAVVESYQDLVRPLPPNTQLSDVSGPLWFETLVTTS
jgi:antitoxin HicB